MPAGEKIRRQPLDGNTDSGYIRNIKNGVTQMFTARNVIDFSRRPVVATAETLDGCVAAVLAAFPGFEIASREDGDNCADLFIFRAAEAHVIAIDG